MDKLIYAEDVKDLVVEVCRKGLPEDIAQETAQRIVDIFPAADPYKQVYDVLLERFEAEEQKAFEKEQAGLKEHAVWYKAIRIIEEYVK